MIRNNLTNDRVFGVLNHQTLDAFYEVDRLKRVADWLTTSTGTVFVVGWGAALTPIAFDRLVLADMARWEIQQRLRAGAPNWRCQTNGAEDILPQVQARLLRRVAGERIGTSAALFDRVDFVLDGNAPPGPRRHGPGRRRLPGRAGGGGRRATLSASCRSSTRAPWGGQWMRGVLASTTSELWLVLRLRSRGEQSAPRLRRRAHRIAVHRSRVQPAARLLGDECMRALATSFPSASTSSTRWAAAICHFRCIRSRNTSSNTSACTTRRTRAITCWTRDGRVRLPRA